MSNKYEELLQRFKDLKFKISENTLSTLIDESNRNQISIVDTLLTILRAEQEERRRIRTEVNIKVAAFPFVKDIDSYDFTYQPSVNELVIRSLATGSFITDRKNVIFYGNSGVGKTHLSVALGVASINLGISTYFIKCAKLMENLRKAKEQNRLEERLKHYCKYQLLIIDELGYLPIGEEESKLFFQLIDRRYEKKSTVITTNINFSSWQDIFKDTKTTGAIVDRLLHHCEVIYITGKSYRMKDLVIED